MLVGLVAVVVGRVDEDVVHVACMKERLRSPRPDGQLGGRYFRKKFRIEAGAVLDQPVHPDFPIGDSQDAVGGSACECW